VDYNRTLAELQSFIDLTELVSRPQTQERMMRIGDNRKFKGQHDKTVEKAHVIEQILDRAIPTCKTN
jgi:hypothetical protein